MAHDRLRGVVTFRVGPDWVALPTAAVASLHWRGLLADHCDPQTGFAYLQLEVGLVPLLDLQALTGKARRVAPEFVLVVRNEAPGAAPSLAGLLVEEFGGVVPLDGELLPPPANSSWWSEHLLPDHGALILTRHGHVPILCARRLIAAATQWSAEGSSW